MRNVLGLLAAAAITYAVISCACGCKKPLPPPPPRKKPCNCFYKRYNGQY